MKPFTAKLSQEVNAGQPSVQKEYYDDGYGASGCIFVARDTGRILLAHRNAEEDPKQGYVEEPDTWATWGGKIEHGESPKDAVVREVEEETGYSGDYKLAFLWTYEDHEEGFQYHNFLAIVDYEFLPERSWENDRGKWVEFGEWPRPMHFGLKALIQHAGEKIQRVVTLIKRKKASLLERRMVRKKMPRVITEMIESQDPHQATLFPKGLAGDGIWGYELRSPKSYVRYRHEPDTKIFYLDNIGTPNEGDQDKGYAKALLETFFQLIKRQGGALDQGTYTTSGVSYIKHVVERLSKQYGVRLVTGRDSIDEAVSPELKQWFGNSKVVDKHGDPLVVWKGMRWKDDVGKPITHIQRQEEFPAFNKSEAGVKGIAGFFTSDQTVARKFCFGPNTATKPFYLRIENPFVIDMKGGNAGDAQFDKQGQPFRDAMRSGKYDGAIILNTKDEGNVFVITNPSQAKLATNKTFGQDKDFTKETLSESKLDFSVQGKNIPPEEVKTAVKLLYRFFKERNTMAWLTSHKWFLKSVKTGHSWIDGERYEFEYIPKKGRESERQPFPDAGYTRKMKAFRTPKDAVDYMTANEKKYEGHYAFRGMNMAEWVDAQRQGYIKSKAEYNLGGVSQTYYGSNWSTAHSYAGGFAPFDKEPTRSLPGVIVAVPFEMTKDAKAETGMGSHGERVAEKIPLDQVKGVWYIVPTEVGKGSMELVLKDGNLDRGSASPPPARFVIVPKSGVSKLNESTIHGREFPMKVYHGGAMTATKPVIFVTRHLKVAQSYANERKGKIHSFMLDIKNPADNAVIDGLAAKLGLEGSGGPVVTDSPTYEYLSPEMVGYDVVNAMVHELSRMGYDSAWIDGDFSMEDSFTEYDSFVVWDKSVLKPVVDKVEGEGKLFEVYGDIQEDGSSPWEMTSDERRKIRVAPENRYRQGRPMAYSFDYVAVEPQVEGIVSTLHSLGIATNQSAGFGDATGMMGAIPTTAVGFEPSKISPHTLDKIRTYLESVATGVVVQDGAIKFEYKFPSGAKLSTIDAQRLENAKPAIEIWSGVEQILKQGLLSEAYGDKGDHVVFGGVFWPDRVVANVVKSHNSYFGHTHDHGPTRWSYYQGMKTVFWKTYPPAVPEWEVVVKDWLENRGYKVERQTDKENYYKLVAWYQKRGLLKEMEDSGVILGALDKNGSNLQPVYSSDQLANHPSHMKTTDRRWRYYPELGQLDWQGRPTAEEHEGTKEFLAQRGLMIRRVHYLAGAVKKESTLLMEAITDEQAKAAVEFLKKMVAEGPFRGQVHLAGGPVRDMIMGKTPKDLDLSVVSDTIWGALKFTSWLANQMGNYKGPSGPPPTFAPHIQVDDYGCPKFSPIENDPAIVDAIEAYDAYYAQYSNPVIFPKFGTAKLNLMGMFNGVDLTGVEVEAVSARKEIYEPGNRKPIEVLPGTLEDDAKRRDFRCNSLLMDLTTNNIFDVTGKGIEDINNRILITTSDPELIFREDPLRMMRAVRFMVQKGFQISPETEENIKKNASWLKFISRERVRDEIDKIIVTKDPGAAFRKMNELGLLQYVAPEFQQMIGMTQNVHHEHDVFDHTMAVLANTNPELVRRRIALFHDIGKLVTRRVTPKGVQFIGHESEGPNVARKVMASLKYPTTDIDAVVVGIQQHMRLKHGGDDAIKISDETLRRFKIAVGKYLEHVLDVIHADNISHADASAMPNQIVNVRRLLDREDMKSLPSQPELPISGDDLIAVGYKPGPKIGKVLSAVTNAWYKNPKITKQDAFNIAKSIQ